MYMSPDTVIAQHYELRFESLYQSGRGYAFPCDAKGQVLLDELSERARANYLFARAVVGRDLDTPQVVATA
jgi:hypothetical protein